MTLCIDLSAKRGLVVGVANEHSIAYGCARALREAGAKLAATYLNSKAEPFVRPLAEALQADIIAPCDVSVAGQLEAIFEQMKNMWGGLDFVLHSIAFAPRNDLHARVVDCSAAGLGGADRMLPMGRRACPRLNGGSYCGIDAGVEVR
jgi:enoyl-[acyl-carrier protein] reductase I